MKWQILAPKPFHKIAVALFVEEALDASSHFGADFFSLLQFLFARGRDFIEIAEGLSQELRGALAHKGDSQGIEYPRQRLTPRGVDIGDQLLRRLLAHPLQLDKLLRRQAVQVRDAADQALIHKLTHQRVAQPVDIHYASRGEMKNRFLETRGTIRVDAAAGRLSLHAHHL